MRWLNWFKGRAPYELPICVLALVMVLLPVGFLVVLMVLFALRSPLP